MGAERHAHCTLSAHALLGRLRQRWHLDLSLCLSQRGTGSSQTAAGQGVNSSVVRQEARGPLRSLAPAIQEKSTESRQKETSGGLPHNGKPDIASLYFGKFARFLWIYLVLKFLYIHCANAPRKLHKVVQVSSDRHAKRGETAAGTVGRMISKRSGTTRTPGSCRAQDRFNRLEGIRHDGEENEARKQRGDHYQTQRWALGSAYIPRS